MNKLLNFNIFLNDHGDLNVLGKLAKIVLILVSIWFITNVVDKIIDKAISNKKLTKLYTNDKRINTVAGILKKTVKIILYFIGSMIILEMFNINTTSILATAGIGGLAVGFGAQSLVKDLITGFFILSEDQYAIGDYVKIGDYEGIVEELGLRVTKLRDFTGDLHIIPNSSIQIVSNRTRGSMRAMVKVSVSYDENIDRVVKILEDVCLDIKKNNTLIVEGPTILGVTDLGEYKVDITIIAKSQPMEQWAVEREIRKKVKEAFDKENIEIPYPKGIIYGGSEK
ncbi:mechanosensitive ion channel family protein [Paratissierella segnis]|uniref:Mechanosensitive ion channel family protein n=1 Tax=Paratissierella segnis TaxID=2763679 RepID=A0A926EW89_9FIRM|nr:mechanosensitive ion channel family protein [Paratissierella segnis]MBC8587380.1 mechanosensitive ion channel family protein [Paratissierella segnis]